LRLSFAPSNYDCQVGSSLLTATQLPYIEFRETQVEYPGHVKGLRGVSLSVSRGEFIFLVGRTGAGKSTLLKLLTGEIRPKPASVFINGEDLSKLRDWEVPRLRREMGIVPQDFALLPRKRVWENVAYAMRAVGKSRKEVRVKVPEILEQVNIGHRADAFPDELSGGEQQRVAIARALINDPPLLLADEPTGNLDPEHSWEIMEVLKSLNQRGTTVVVASHDMMIIHRMGKRVVTLEAGQVMSDTGELPVDRESELTVSNENQAGIPDEIEDPDEESLSKSCDDD